MGSSNKDREWQKIDFKKQNIGFFGLSSRKLVHDQEAGQARVVRTKTAIIVVTLSGLV